MAQVVTDERSSVRKVVVELELPTCTDLRTLRQLCNSNRNRWYGEQPPNTKTNEGILRDEDGEEYFTLEANRSSLQGKKRKQKLLNIPLNIYFVNLNPTLWAEN